MKITSFAMAASLLMMSVGVTVAAPVVATLGDFTAAAAVVNFNSIANTAPINSQYSGSGVAFSGALVGLTQPGDTILFNQSTIASNWIYNIGNQGPTWTATFSSMQNIAGFYVETNPEDDVTIEAFSGVTSLGTVNFLNANGLVADFIGVRDMSGFDRITVTTANKDNGFFAMDDFRFEQRGNAVPEPASLALFGLALASLTMVRRRKA